MATSKFALILILFCLIAAMANILDVDNLSGTDGYYSVGSSTVVIVCDLSIILFLVAACCSLFRLRAAALIALAGVLISYEFFFCNIVSLVRSGFAFFHFSQNIGWYSLDLAKIFLGNLSMIAIAYLSVRILAQKTDLDFKTLNRLDKSILSDEELE